MRIARAGFIISVAVFMVLSSTPASAWADGEWYSVRSNDRNWRGHASSIAFFNPDGEHLRVCDEREDGKRAYARLTWRDSNGTRRYATLEASGNGNCSNKNLDIGEDKSATLTACGKDLDVSGHKLLDCNSKSVRT